MKNMFVSDMGKDIELENLMKYQAVVITQGFRVKFEQKGIKRNIS